MAHRPDRDPEINDRELVTTRVLAASPEVVFDVWTDPAHITSWWGPDGFATVTRAMDLRPGGLWRFTMRGPDGRNYENRIEFIEVSKPSRLVYRHRDEGEVEPVQFHVTVTFAALGKKTLLTMRMVFENAEDLARTEEAYGASEGLLQTLARLANYLIDRGTNTNIQTVAPRSDRELATSRMVSAAPERVFDAFRDPEKLATWWGPNGFTNTFHEFDFRPGGAWKLTMHGPDGKNYPNELVFVEIEEPRRIVIDHRSKPEYVAEFEFVPTPGGTKILFYHIFESAEVCQRIAKFAGDANEQNLTRLAEVLRATAADEINRPRVVMAR